MKAQRVSETRKADSCPFLSFRPWEERMPLSGGHPPQVPQWVTAASPEEEGTAVTDGPRFSKTNRANNNQRMGLIILFRNIWKIKIHGIECISSFKI